MDKKNNESRRLIAIEEWKLASSVIGRLENVEHQMRNWLFALLTALTVALYSKDIDLSGISFIIIGLLLVTTFVWMDLMHRIPKRSAIELSKKIEESLKDNNIEYAGPSLSTALAGKRIGKWNELKRMLKNTPYVQIMILVVLLGLAYELVNKAGV
jgi:hypothetical protein